MNDSESIKGVVWDLDDTIWPGNLPEGSVSTPSAAIVEVIRTLDERGIVQSIASRSPREPALDRLRQCALIDYFLCPQLEFGPKSGSVREISRRLGIAPRHLALVDDQSSELDEVRQQLPEVMCILASDAVDIPAMSRMRPPHRTAESSQRRAMYAAELARVEDAARFPGSPEEFLRSLGLDAEIFRMTSQHLVRAAELVGRVHQLNTTGHAYSLDQLAAVIGSAGHVMWGLSLRDRYGSYGQVGLALIARQPGLWTIKLLLVSCRVLSRGAADVLLWHLRAEARRDGANLQIEFIPNETNSLTSALLKLGGFREVARSGQTRFFEDEAATIESPTCTVQVISN